MTPFAVVHHTNKAVDVEPVTAQTIRERALIASGLTPEVIGECVKRSVAKLTEQLDAKKVQFFAHEGVVCDERVTDDGSLQQKAAVELIKMGIDIAGLQLKGAGNDGNSKLNVTFDLSGWMVTPPEKPVEQNDSTS